MIAVVKGAITLRFIAFLFCFPWWVCACHLIIHFDLNQTLIIGDAVQGKTPEEAIVDALSDQYSDRWDETLREPVDYNSYIKEHLLPNPTKDKAIKAQQKQMLCGFLEYLKAQEHPFYPQVQARYNSALKAFNEQPSLIFSSFYRLLEYLEAKQIAYTLVFRTFGDDLPKVAKELNERLGEDFLPDVARYRFADQALFYDYIKNTTHHLAIQDNWKYWYEHNEESAYGKPFPIDFNDSTYLSLFFDDNARLNLEHPQKNAIAPYDITKGCPLMPYEAVSKGYLFPVDTLEALSDPDYYIRLVESALDNVEARR